MARGRPPERLPRRTFHGVEYAQVQRPGPVAEGQRDDPDRRRVAREVEHRVQGLESLFDVDKACQSGRVVRHARLSPGAAPLECHAKRVTAAKTRWQRVVLGRTGWIPFPVLQPFFFGL